MSENSNTFKIHFLPNDTFVDVNDGSTVLDAAHKANIYINSICGGDGICGKCKVILSSGTVDALPTKQLSNEEVEKDYILACEASVTSDLQILVPQETRLEGKKILLDQNEQHSMTWKAILDQANSNMMLWLRRSVSKWNPLQWTTMLLTTNGSIRLL
jgi:uncharacterized 2Fe-2S/4Fe-4S cluster protein (DUF4445 family)